MNLSATEAIELLENIYEIEFVLPESGKKETRIINLSEEQKRLIRVSSS